MEPTRQFFDPAKLPTVYHPGETLDEKLQEMGMSVKESVICDLFSHKVPNQKSRFCATFFPSRLVLYIPQYHAPQCF